MAKPRQEQSKEHGRSAWCGHRALHGYSSFFILPAIIKSQMLKRLPALTHRHVAVGEVRLNPYALSFTLRGFSLTETNGDEFVSLDELYVNFESISLLKRGFVFKEIHVKKPSANIVRLTGRYIQLFEPVNEYKCRPAEAKPSTPSSGKQRLPLVIIESLKVEDGQFSFTDLDRKKPFQRRFGPIDVTSHRFHDPSEERQPILRRRQHEGWGKFCLVGGCVNRAALFGGHVQVDRAASGQICRVCRGRCADPGSRWGPRGFADGLPCGRDGRGSQCLHFQFDGGPVRRPSNNGATQTPPERAWTNCISPLRGVSLDTAAKRLDVAEIRLTDLVTGVTLLPAPATQAVAQDGFAATPWQSHDRRQRKPTRSRSRLTMLRLRMRRSISRMNRSSPTSNPQSKNSTAA